ncbi:MAG: tetratricopeptide repeat protein [Candidatus Schekmanbacteria bacterium]|nr:tetratricopeptide repeat protein [Candidatus Schekmanbacteria bacterium]
MSVIYNKLKQVEQDQTDEVLLEANADSSRTNKEVLPIDKTLQRQSAEKKSNFLRNLLVGGAIFALAVTLSVVTAYIRGKSPEIAAKPKINLPQVPKSGIKPDKKESDKHLENKDFDQPAIPENISQKTANPGKTKKVKATPDMPPGPPESVMQIRKEYETYLSKQTAVKPVEEIKPGSDRDEGLIELSSTREKDREGIIKPPTKDAEDIAEIQGGYQQFIPVFGAGGPPKFIDPKTLIKENKKESKEIKGLNKSENEDTTPEKKDINIASLDKLTIKPLVINPAKPKETTGANASEAEALKEPPVNKGNEAAIKSAVNPAVNKEKESPNKSIPIAGLTKENKISADKKTKEGQTQKLVPVKKSQIPSQETSKKTTEPNKTSTKITAGEKLSNPVKASATKKTETSVKLIPKAAALPSNKDLNNPPQTADESKGEMLLAMREVSKPEESKEKLDDFPDEELEISPVSDKRIPLLAMGQNYFKDKKLDDAIKSYKRALEEDPELLEAYNNLGVIYTQKGWFKSAIKNFKMAIKNNPYYADAHFNLAILYEKQTDNKQALVHYLKFIEYAQPKHRQLVEQVQKHISYY